MVFSYRQLKKIFLLAFFCSLIYTSLPAHNWSWAKSFHYDDMSLGKTIGSDYFGNFYVTGRAYHPAGGSDALQVLYDAQFNISDVQLQH